VYHSGERSNCDASHTKPIVVSHRARVGRMRDVSGGPNRDGPATPGKSFEQFQTEDVNCRQWAGQQIGVSPQDTANQNTAAGAVIGTALEQRLAQRSDPHPERRDWGGDRAASGLVGGTAVGLTPVRHTDGRRSVGTTWRTTVHVR